ncbi:LptM family lipoprotein [Enterococcus quebecensis]|uniref:Lipoprotein n=1 Tax=Enterococcus quebecensis TaxID=903983 RepID=A0A1E5GTA8_9ENTE|nr:hypothetical protein [Enterococcus quebecensis]OEG15510.1 hypothetical protein BCR23_08560 [Enterococcus quebecensis]OJG73988.1 hypothetical protein RV12_GL000336 [Enterococcus quebecensis]
MKRWISWLTVLGIILSLAGCGQNIKTTSNEKLPKNEVAFTWWSDRFKSFGEYNYTGINEKQAMEDLKNRFQVELLPSFEIGRDIIKSGFLIDGASQEPEEFSFVASKSELGFTSQVKFKNKENQYTSYGTVTAKYQYLENLNKVKLSSQRIEIYNSTANGNYNGNDLADTLKQLGSLLQLDDLDKLLMDFNKETADQGNIKGKDIVIYEDFHEGQKKRSFGKSMGVTYNEFGVLEKIYAITIDYRI